MTQQLLNKPEKFKITIEIDWTQYPNNNNVTLINSNGDTFTSDSEGFIDFLYNEKPVEELEVPIAGVTDEEIFRKCIQFGKELQQGLHGDILISDWISKLAVTGSKPLKTEDEEEAIKSDDSDIRQTWLKSYYGGNGDPYIEIIYICNDGYKRSTSVRVSLSGGNAPHEVKMAVAKLAQAMQFPNSTPIDTLDKEELLKQAKDNVAKNFNPVSFASLFMMYEEEIDALLVEYLRLCTGGGEKE